MNQEKENKLIELINKSEMCLFSKNTFEDNETFKKLVAYTNEAERLYSKIIAVNEEDDNTPLEEIEADYERLTDLDEFLEKVTYLIEQQEMLDKI